MASSLKEQLETAEKMRSEWATSDAKRDSGLKPRNDVVAIQDVVYTDSASSEEEVYHKMDIYYPNTIDINNLENESIAVIVSVHGGGWFYGDKELYSHYCMRLAAGGFAVVDFNYRLSPKYKYPDGFMDVCALFKYLYNNGKRLGMDLSQVNCLGDSAGAQLLSQYCIWATNKDYRNLLSDGSDWTLVPKRIALNCGIYDMRDMVGRESLVEMYLTEDIAVETMNDIAKICEKSDLAKSFYNVIDYMTSDFPETYLMLSVNDALKVHTLPMKKKLEDLGINHVFREFGEGSPADAHVFHVNMKSELGEKCNSEEIAFFKGEL